jgi:hypothetical protein
MDLKRNTIETRAWIERQWLPEGWEIVQNGTGQYLKVQEKSGHTAFTGVNWAGVSAYCAGVNAGVTVENKRQREQVT